jgi:hypothetical protein
MNAVSIMGTRQFSSFWKGQVKRCSRKAAAKRFVHFVINLETPLPGCAGQVEHLVGFGDHRLPVFTLKAEASDDAPAMKRRITDPPRVLPKFLEVGALGGSKPAAIEP